MHSFKSQAALTSPTNADVNSLGRSAISTTAINNDIDQTVDVAQEFATEAANDTGEVLDKVGEGIADAGVVLAPFTEGASLALVPVGEIMSAGGKLLKGGNHLAQGNYEEAVAEGTNLGIGLVTSGLTEEAMTQSRKVGNITNNTEAITQEGTLGAIGSAWNKAWGQVVNFFSTENESNDE